MKKIGTILFSIFFAAACSPSREDLAGTGAGSDLAIEWTLLRNGLDHGGAQARFTLKNLGDTPFPAAGWAIYYTQVVSGVHANSLPSSVQIEVLSGDWCRLAPTSDFEAIAPGDSVTIDYQTNGPVIKDSWAPSGVYIVFSDELGQEGAPELIDQYVVTPFTAPEQINRGEGDQVPIPTPVVVYHENAGLSLLPESELVPIVPTPASYRSGSGTVTVTPDTRIVYGAGLEKEAAYLAGMLNPALGKALPAEEGNSGGPDVILLQTGAITVNGEPRRSEAYTLEVADGAGIQITGADAAGVFYGLQSLIGLMPPDAMGKRAETIDVPAVSIADAPRFGYRGMHLDIARNFQTLESVRRLIDLMAVYKLNKLHFHFSEDEGWRLEIPDLPELTQVGAFRGHTLTEEEHLHPSWGSGPFTDPSASHGSGFYSRQQYIEMLRFAADRHIEVIPEIEMPGHARAAIVSMKARQRKTDSDEYILHDPEDQSEYVSVQGYDDNVICPCQESTYRFIETVVSNIVDMHKDAGAPLTTIHIGGDEVPPGVWEKSPACAKLIAENDQVNDVVDINYYWVRRSGEILQRFGLKTSGWEEIGLERTAGGYAPHPEFAGGNFIPYVWNNLGENVDLGNRLANAGYPVVLCSVTNMYFDLAYNKDPEEPGLIWGGFIHTRSPWEFVPEDVFKSTTHDNMGNRLNTEGFYRERESLTDAGLGRILGIQGELWTETVRGQQMMEYYIFPKLLGLSERAWAQRPAWAATSNPDRRKDAMETDWNQFANRLGQRELPRLDNLFGGTQYRLPPPGASIENGLLDANVAFPGLTIRYTTDGSEPTASSPVFENPVEVSGPVKLRTFDSKGRGSRTVGN